MDVINSKVTERHSVKPKVAQAHTTSLQRYTNIFIIALWSKTGKKKRSHPSVKNFTFVRSPLPLLMSSWFCIKTKLPYFYGWSIAPCEFSGRI